MEFFGILLLTFLCLMTLIYICKLYFKNNEYIIEEDMTPEDLEILHQHINNINNVAVNYNPNNNMELTNELPPKYEEIQNEPPNYQSSNSS
jgi:hypothetical protein